MAKVKKVQGKKPIIIILLLISIVILLGILYLKTQYQPMNQEPQQLATTYAGTLPCADCSGLHETVTLIKSSFPQKGVYVEHDLYEGKMTTPIVTEGSWTITKGTPDNPNAYVLQLYPKDGSGVTNYLMEKAKITLLDQNKRKIDSPFNESLYRVTKQSTLPNPASENCTNIGGQVVIQKRGDGGEYGLCQFDDNRACEEWALYRGECPVGGVKTTGYDTIAQKYCAWLGGQTLAVPNATCTLPNGDVCGDEALYNGTCK